MLPPNLIGHYYEVRRTLAEGEGKETTPWYRLTAEEKAAVGMDVEILRRAILSAEEEQDLVDAYPDEVRGARIHRREDSAHGQDGGGMVAVSEAGPVAVDAVPRLEFLGGDIMGREVSSRSHTVLCVVE